MKKFDIFKSEGGYRLALGIYGDDPVLNSCPWYATEEEAKVAQEKAIKEHDTSEFKNTSDNWQVWVNVFTEKQEMVLEGTEEECDKFVRENNANRSAKYGSVFMIAPHTGRRNDFSRFEC